MVDPLISDPALLDDFPGAPFPEIVVTAAEESVRDEAGWHIAPVVTETVTVDGSGASPYLLLPSLRIVSVASVRALVDDAWVDLTGWRIAGSGMLWRSAGWAYGIAAVEVTMSHGYPTVPAGLLPVVAARCQRSMVDATMTQRSETAGGRTLSESYNINRLEIEASATGLDRYKLAGRVA
jgi:hypothetical protein